VCRFLEGNEDSLKERNIAVDVFGRRIDYNSSEGSEDSFVRFKASEVRRRLGLSLVKNAISQGNQQVGAVG
jgi:hypothetical protein